MGHTAGKELSDWAAEELASGQDSPHLRALAGLPKPYHWSELDDIFHKTLAELGLEEPQMEEVLRRYARLIAGDIIEGAVNEEEGCEILFTVSEELASPPALNPFVRLYWDLQELKDGYGANFFPITSIKEFNEVAKEEAQRFLQEDLYKLAHDLEEPSTGPTHSLLELRGLGKEIWGSADAQEYINELRDEWNGE